MKIKLSKKYLEKENQRLAKIVMEKNERIAELEGALVKCLDWILLGNHEEFLGWIEARDVAIKALKKEKV